MKTRTVKPCGFLSTHSDTSYFLLHPYPIAKDSWQDDSTHRFVCVPLSPIEFNDNAPDVFAYARHVVTNSFAIEYRAEMKEIVVQVLEDVDVTATELHDVSEEEISNILEENDYGI